MAKTRKRARTTKRVRGAGCGASCTVEQRIAELQDKKMTIELQQRINKKNLLTAETKIKGLVRDGKSEVVIRAKAAEIIQLKGAIIKQEEAKSALDAMIDKLKLGAGQAALAKGVTSAVAFPRPTTPNVKRFVNASARVNAAQKAFINASASAAGVSASEVNARIKKTQAEVAADLSASLPPVPTGPVVIGGRLKSRRRK